MKIVDDYRTRIQQADTTEQKRMLANELHQLADSFSTSERDEYEQAMHELRQQISQQLNTINSVNERAIDILNRYTAIKTAL